MGDRRILEEVDKDFSFRDKSVEYQLNRFRKSCEFRERTGKLFPDYATWKIQKEQELLSKLDVKCCELDIDILRVPVGLMPRLEAWFKERKIAYGVKSFVDTKFNKRLFTAKESELRKPQRLALEELERNRYLFGMIRIATGVGKTRLAETFILRKGFKTIFLVPSRPILNQTFKRFEDTFGKKNVGILGDGKSRHSWITVATYQSVNAAEEKDFEDYTVAFFDEAHHVPADTFFDAAQKKLKKVPIRIGLSADEERADGATILVEAAVGPVIYSYEADEAIADKLLAKPTFIVHSVTRTEGFYIKWGRNKKGERVNEGTEQSRAVTEDDYFLAYKNWVLGNRPLTEWVANMAAILSEDSKSSLILVDEKEHGEKFIEAFRAIGFDKFEFVYGGRPENEDILAAFNKREIPVIIATSVWGEGTDTIPVDHLFNLMGGRRPKQANGRALRNDPDEKGVPRKPECTIHDFTFPLSPVLSRHAESRIAVHSKCGLVHRADLQL